MTDSNKEMNERRPGGAGEFFFVLSDAVLYVVGLYVVINAALLRMDNVVDIPGLLPPVAIFVTFLFVSRGFYALKNQSSIFFGLFLELILFFIFVVGAALATTRLSAEGMNALPLWWREFPLLLKQLAAISPFLAFCLAFLCASLIYFVTAGKRNIPVGAVAVLLAASLLCYHFVFRNYFRAVDLLAILAFAAFPLAGAILMKPRLFARSILIFAIGFFAALHFLGIQPFVSNPAKPEDGIARIYPVALKSEILPFFISDVFATDAGELLIAGGKTGRISILDPEKGKEIAIYRDGDADFSSISLNRNTGDIYALDSAGGGLLVFKNNSPKAPRVVNIPDEWCRSPKTLLLKDKVFYVACDFFPGLMEFNIESMEQTGGIKLRETGATPFRTGAWGVEAHEQSGMIFILSGATVERDKSMIAVADALRFRMIGSVMLPEMESGIAMDAPGSRLFTTSANSGNIYEIIFPEMRHSRILKGPVGAKAVVYDPLRNFLYAGGEYNGIFAAVSAVSGKIARQTRICSGITGIKLSQTGEDVFATCRDGIYDVNLEKYLGPGDKLKTY